MIGHKNPRKYNYTNCQLLVKIKQPNRKHEHRIKAGWNDNSENRNHPDENQPEDLQALQPHDQEEDDHEEATVDILQAKELLNGLKREGFEIKITDLSNNTTRSIHPALGRITRFLDPDIKSQAIVKYSKGRVDRPISKLVVVVRADEQIPTKEKCFCPLAETDEQVQENHEEQEVVTLGPDDEDETASHKGEELQEELHRTAEHVPEENQHENLQEALHPHVTEEDNKQEVHRHPPGAQPSLTPRRQKMTQEEDRDKETHEDRSPAAAAAGPAAGPLPQDYTLPQGTAPDKGNQGRPQRKKNPLDKF